jgi:hypothetical protein
VALFFFSIVLLAGAAQGQNLAKVRAAYTSIGINSIRFTS